MIARRTVRISSPLNRNPQDRAGEGSANPLPDDYAQRHPRDGEPQSHPQAQE